MVVPVIMSVIMSVLVIMIVVAAGAVLMARLVRRDLLLDLLHVELLRLADELLERSRRQRTGLAEQQHAIAEQHERRNRLDAGGTGELLLRLGVDLAERHVGVCRRRLLEHRREHLAGPAPLGPEVEEHDPWFLDRVLEVLRGDLDSCHPQRLASERSDGKTRIALTSGDALVLGGVPPAGSVRG